MHGDCNRENIIAEKYRILELLGKGGFASVYRVRDEHLHKEYAMKIMEECNVAQEEALRLAGLQHEGLPMLHDVFEQDHKTYLVMELSRGDNLKHYIKKRGKLTIEETVKIGLRIGDVLQYLHKRPIPVVHGDLKPENIMVGPDKIQLIDFGGAYLMYSRREFFYGTPGYAAVELQRGEILPQSDIYSFGKVLLYMLTGREGVLFTSELSVKQLKRYGIPRKLCKVILKCLEKEPFGRYQSGVELTKALRELKGLNRQLPGQGLAVAAEISRFMGMTGVLIALYGVKTGMNIPGAEFFVLSCAGILLSCIMGRYATDVYHSAILECECSMFVTEGV